MKLDLTAACLALAVVVMLAWATIEGVLKIFN
jgi:hypothetical protein